MRRIGGTEPGRYVKDKMIRIAAAGMLAALLAAAAPPDDKEDLAKAAEKTRELENYKFKGRIAVDGVPFLAEPIDYSGSYAKDKGFTATLGPIGTIFRLGKKVAVKDAESGEWILLKPGTKIGEGPLAAQIPIVARGLKPPHEELKKLEARFKEIKKKPAPEKIGDIECAVYEGALTEGGVKASLPGGVGLLLGKGTFEGTGRAWVGPEGRILRFESDCKIQIEQDGKTSDLAVTRTTEIADVGRATVDMPADVKRLFDQDDSK